MPAYKQLSDQQVADVTNYNPQFLGNAAALVTADQVAKGAALAEPSFRGAHSANPESRDSRFDALHRPE